MDVAVDFEAGSRSFAPLMAASLSADDGDKASPDVTMSHADKHAFGGAPSSDGASLTWDVVRANTRLARTFEDPITGASIDVSEFFAVYGPVLRQLDGSDMSSYVDFFWLPSPIDITSWQFVDDDTRQDFLDWAVELECVPPMCEVQAGESQAELAARRAKEQQLQQHGSTSVPTPSAESTTAIGGASIIGGGITPALDAETLRAYADREREVRAAALREQAARAKEAAERDAARKRASKAKAGNKKEAQLVASLHKLSAALAAPELDDAKRAKLENKRDRVISMLSHSSEGHVSGSVTRSRSGGRVASTGGAGGGVKTVAAPATDGAKPEAE